VRLRTNASLRHLALLNVAALMVISAPVSVRDGALASATAMAQASTCPKEPRCRKLNWRPVCVRRGPCGLLTGTPVRTGCVAWRCEFVSAQPPAPPARR